MAEPTIVIPDAIRESDTLRAPVEQASEWLRKILRNYTEPFTAVWGIALGRGSKQYASVELSLPTLDQPVRGVFTPEELADRKPTESDLQLLYLQLLRLRSRQMIERIMEPVAQTAEVA